MGLRNSPSKFLSIGKQGLCLCEVSDHGDGISSEEQAHLFERFFRGKNVEEEGGGIGIGLALCKGIIDAHNGHIGVRSQIGEGATFGSVSRGFENPGKSPKNIAQGGIYEGRFGR